MTVIFKEDGHIYQSLNDDLTTDDIKWTSVTSFVGLFKPKFDADKNNKDFLSLQQIKEGALDGTIDLSDESVVTQLKVANEKAQAEAAKTIGQTYKGQGLIDLKADTPPPIPQGLLDEGMIFPKFGGTPNVIKNPFDIAFGQTELLKPFGTFNNPVVPPFKIK